MRAVRNVSLILLVVGVPLAYLSTSCHAWRLSSWFKWPFSDHHDDNDSHARGQATRGVEYEAEHGSAQLPEVIRSSTGEMVLRGSQQGPEPLGTICIYQAPHTSCAKRKTHPGKLQTCSREVDDGICMNFPCAGAVFTCGANEKVNMYRDPGCTSGPAEAEFVSCVDMTEGTYFLLCCTSESNESGQMDCDKLSAGFLKSAPTEVLKNTADRTEEDEITVASIS